MLKIIPFFLERKKIKEKIGSIHFSQHYSTVALYAYTLTRTGFCIQNIFTFFSSITRTCCVCCTMIYFFLIFYHFFFFLKTYYRNVHGNRNSHDESLIRKWQFFLFFFLLSFFFFRTRYSYTTLATHRAIFICGNTL